MRRQALFVLFFGFAALGATGCGTDASPAAWTPAASGPRTSTPAPTPIPVPQLTLREVAHFKQPIPRHDGAVEVHLYCDDRGDLWEMQSSGLGLNSYPNQDRITLVDERDIPFCGWHL